MLSRLKTSYDKALEALCLSDYNSSVDFFICIWPVLKEGNIIDDTSRESKIQYPNVLRITNKQKKDKSRDNSKENRSV